MSIASLSAVIRAWGHAWNAILWVDRFIRLHFLFFSGLLPLLGASTVRHDLSTGQIAMLLGVGGCFHIFSYVLNDVVDLPIDRTQPLRQLDPLVMGVVRPGHALLFVLIQPLLAAWLTNALGGGGRAQATLAAGFGLMTVYNLVGKRCPVPPVTDVVQGLAWGSLAVYAAQVFRAPVTPLAWAVAIYAATFILFINGIHGGLRDLRNDLANGARTTAIFLGARPAAGTDDPFVPRSVQVFASLTLAALIAVGFTPLLRNDFAYTPGVRLVTFAAVGSLDAVAAILLPFVVRPRHPVWDIAFRLQMYVVLVALPVAFVAFVSTKTLLVLLVLTCVSLLPLEWTYIVARSAGQTVQSAVRVIWGET